MARLRVDYIACDGRGICAEMLPELITADDWGFPIVTGEPVPLRLLGDARVTARACPRLALRLEGILAAQGRSFRRGQGCAGDVAE